MKNLIKKWLGVTSDKRKPPTYSFKVDHPDFLDAQMSPEIQEACAHFFKASMPGRVLVANLYQDINDLMQEASATPDQNIRNYLICKAGGQREQLAKILQICVMKADSKSDSQGVPVTQDELTSALGHDYEIGEER